RAGSVARRVSRRVGAGAGGAAEERPAADGSPIWNRSGPLAGASRRAARGGTLVLAGEGRAGGVLFQTVVRAAAVPGGGGDGGDRRRGRSRLRGVASRVPSGRRGL